jgi:hypothetical protein
VTGDEMQELSDLLDGRWARRTVNEGDLRGTAETTESIQVQYLHASRGEYQDMQGKSHPKVRNIVRVLTGQARQQKNE